MYASTKESFVFQVVTILESMEYSKHPNDLTRLGLAIEGSAYVGMREEVTDSWAKAWMGHVWKAIEEAGI